MQKKRPTLFKGRHFEGDVIILCVRRYLRFALSLRNVEELMAERNLSVDHLTLGSAVRTGAGRRCRLGVWTRPTVARQGKMDLFIYGCGFGRRTPATSSFLQRVMHLQPSACFKRRCVLRTIPDHESSKVSGLTALPDGEISCMSRKECFDADYASRNINSRAWP